MSHLRRVIALIMLALLGWLVAFGAVGAASVSAADDNPAITASAGSLCC